MTFLEKLTTDHRIIIVRLPYRVGLWVSKSDASGGSEADERELQALSSILHGFAEEVFGSETIQHIMSETIRQKADWPKWGYHLDAVPEDCRIAVDILREHGDEKDVNAFKVHILEIAEAVAAAFRERENMSPLSTFIMYLHYIFEAPQKGRRKKSFEEFINVSASERKALKAISDALEAA